MNRKTGLFCINLVLFIFSPILAGRTVELQYHEVKEKYNPDFARVHRSGFDKIIVRSFLNNGAEGGLLFKSDAFRMAYPGFERILGSQPDRDFKLWGWMIARNFDWIEDAGLLDTSFRDGKRKTIKKLDIFNPGVREKVVSAFRDLARTGVDGILIQDDLSIRNNEGFSERAMKLFEMKAGVPAREKLMMESHSPYNKKWISIKRSVISEFLKEIIKACREINPRIEIGVNAYYEVSILENESREWHSQDLDLISGSGADRVYLMMYHRQMKRELKYDWKTIKELFREGIVRAYDRVGDRLVVKMETRDWITDELIPIGEMKEFIALIPEKVQQICFTPVKGTDLRYLESLLEASSH